MYASEYLCAFAMQQFPKDVQCFACRASPFEYRPVSRLIHTYTWSSKKLQINECPGSFQFPNGTHPQIRGRDADGVEVNGIRLRMEVWMKKRETLDNNRSDTIRVVGISCDCKAMLSSEVTNWANYTRIALTMQPVVASYGRAHAGITHRVTPALARGLGAIHRKLLAQNGLTAIYTV